MKYCRHHRNSRWVVQNCLHRTLRGTLCDELGVVLGISDGNALGKLLGTSEGTALGNPEGLAEGDELGI